ncbi:hypothetical protein MKEN_00249800 [Mycena kentingensis (nom. inval.)]|nr:hypothetical protein MKEN_00249800 [Mycena kentingensis (nom. inval.)]
MSRLASLINYRPNKKKSFISAKTPFGTRRTDPTSPHPYTAEVFDIAGETSFSESEHSQDVPVASSLPTSTLSSSLDATVTPQLNLDLDDFTAADWFPSHFLKTDSVAGPSLVGAAESPAVEPKSKESLATSEMDAEEVEDEDNMSSTSDELANLRALGAADFLNLPEMEGELMPSAPGRKGAPSPIKIPNAALHGPRVEIERTVSIQSRPDSMFSLDGSSAVSGTTLARALIGDSFVLSHDRSSRYRSGGSVLTRSDSATLPRGEQPFSPAWTIRRSGAYTPMDGDYQMPPMPEMPAELKKVIAESRDRLKHTNGGSDSVVDVESPANEVPVDGRRISRITEVATPVSGSVYSSAPDVPQSGSLAPESILALSDTSSPRTPPLGHAGTSPSAFPTSPGQLSNLSGDTRSSRDIDGVLDYYNFDASPSYGSGSTFDPPTPDPRADPSRFHPAFSPITEVTEDSSQVSPNSFRTTNATPSPALSPGPARQEWRPGEIRILPPYPLPPASAPADDRPRLGHTPPPIVIPPPKHIATATVETPVMANDDSALLLPKLGIFNRERAGSAPSPINVVRDSRDMNSYNITVTPLVGTSSGGSTPITGDEEVAARQQTFPETPSAFSPTFSANSDSTSARNSMAPAINGKPGYTSLAQQVLLTRSVSTATGVKGARPSHSRQASRAKNRNTAIFPSSTALNVLKEVLPVSAEEGNEEGKPHVLPLVPPPPPPPPPQPIEQTDKEGPPVSPTTAPEAPDSASLYSGDSYSSPVQLKRRRSQSSDAHSGSLHEVQAPTKRAYDAKPLPMMPTSPVSPASSEEPDLASADTTLVPLKTGACSASASSTSLSAPSSSSSASASPAQPMEGLPFSLSRKPTPAPSERVVEVVLPAQAPPPVVPSTEESASDTEQAIEAPPHRPPLLLTPPAAPVVDARLGSPHIVPLVTPARANGDFDPMHAALGSPPPYYTVMYDSREIGPLERLTTPSTGGLGSYPPEAYTPVTPAIPHRDQRLSFQSIASPSVSTGRGAKHVRPRPPLPVGPRRPTAIVNAGAGPSTGRNRNGSVSSIASNHPGRRVASAPRFQTPPVKWRGYTMEAAKWTFSSAQLQSIVSRAIKQSAEASSIRLLRHETVDTDIPDEMHRLEVQRTDVKTRYKMLTRRRANMLATLTGHLDGTEPEDPTYTLRVVENLKEVSTELDRLAEDLHSCDEQIAQLASLRDVHSASALAMALRKLNASFLKQIAVGETLKQQVATLQAERDEAWSQAVDVANDFDDLHERLEMQSPGSGSSKRSSRVLASKKSSIRVSKAGLRSSSRRSSVSSIGAVNRYSSALSSGTAEDIPPVPPIPRRRPNEIQTDFLSRQSTFTTTPTSESRALDQAQAELYSMLGIPVPHDRNSRRPHSVILSAVSDAENAHNPLLSPTPQRQSERASEISRPSSLPPGNSAKLSEALNALTADRNAILATLGMIND